MSEHIDNILETNNGQLYLHIFVLGERGKKVEDLYSPMYSGRHIIFIYIYIYVYVIYIPGIYTMQPLEGCAAYIIKQEGQGVEVLTTTTTRPSDILENPLPCQKRKGCDICGGLQQLPKLSAH